MVESSILNYQNVDDIRQSYGIERLYDGEEAEGFDLSKASEWIYPINYPVRTYQKNIVSNALFKNTLVCLPTGLGKTFIAAVVMYNYHRWYPNHKIVFMAHSKPLVTQQVNACCNIMGISPSLIAELNGNMQHSSRKKQWESKKIFFLTPQVFNNDLARGNVKAESIRCIVIDEAHKALGNQAYCQVIRSVKPFNKNFRVLALSATPGDDMNMVREVIQNLMISHLELRNEEDADIKPYLHQKKIETVIVKLDQEIINIKEMFLRAVDKYIKPLSQHKLIPQSYSAINSYSLVLKQRQFIQDPSVGPELRGLMLSNFSVAISLFYALEELVVHGMRSFVTKLKNLKTGEGATNKVHHRLGNDHDITSLIEHVESVLGPDQNISFDANVSLTRIFDEIDSIQTSSNVVYSHPKFAILEKIIQEHFEAHKDSTRVIVFCKSRQCTGEICNFLARLKPIVKPMIFIGQSQSSGGIVTKGFNQAAQLTVMKKFRDGVYNTLIATCVAEEGLDIGEVDLIVNFDSGKNSNTQVQRSGRTGRKRDGRVVNLVTEGKEHQNYNISVFKGKKMNKKLVTDGGNLPFYPASPRLIPKGYEPVCEEMHISVKEITEEEPKEKKRKGKGAKKKSDNFEKAETSKRLKGGEGGASLWTVIADENSRTGVPEGNVNEGVVIVDDDKPTMVLYNDDVEDIADEPLESLSADELDSEESGVLVEFLRENNKTLKPKNNFKELLNLNKINKYCKLSGKSDKDLVSKMKAMTNYTLSDHDKKCLVNGRLDLLACFNEARRRLLMGDAGNVKEKPPEVNVAFDIDPEAFFDPFDDIEPSPKKQLISSTPVRNDKENIMPPPVNKSPKPETNFQLWDESDFFNLKVNFTPKRDGNTPGRGRDSSCKKDLSMISITQALDFVNNAESSKNNVGTEGKEKKNEVPDSPASPILFCSQKPKTRNKFVPNSPVLTQGHSGKRSRKCLSFKSETNAGPAPKFQEMDNSDLFAETEVALQNHLQELEEDLNRVMEKKKVEERSPVRSITVLSESSENTEEYDLGKVDLDENSMVASLLQTGNVDTPKVEAARKSDVYDSCFRQLDFNSFMKGNASETRPNAESTPANKSEAPRGSQNVSNPANGGKTKDESNFSRFDFSSFMKDSTKQNRPNTESTPVRKSEAPQKAQNVSNAAQEGKINDDSLFNRLEFSSFMKGNPTETRPIMESTPVRTRPKMAVVRPMGFENTDNPTTNAGTSKSVVKQERPSFSCNFSLFGDDDFSDECLNFDKIDKAEKTAAKVDCENKDDSSDSDIFVTRQNCKSKPRLSPEVDDAELFKNMLDDGELSDGAMEAIKAVEIYEKDEKLAKKAELVDLDSDDSEDFFVPKRKQIKNDSSVNETVETKKKRKKVSQPVSEFVEREADVSDQASSDEENTSGLDEYDSSFVDEREVLTQAQDVDMTAKYLQWAKSPIARPGTFKIPKRRITKELNVFSQIGSEGESEYENDSFCVMDEESETQLNDVSEIEIAEVILEDKKKRKRVKETPGGSVRKKKKFKRVLRISSDSSEDDIAEKAPEPEPSTHETEISEIQELFGSPFPTEKSVPTTAEGKIPVQDVIFIASRQIASAPEITTCLRAKWNVNVYVRSTPEADYIVSWRVGINRISLSDFVNGSPTAKNALMETVTKLSTNFHEPVLIVEDDKNKGLPLTVGCHRRMWARHSMKTLIKVIENRVKVVFSRNKEETARILVQICKQEKNKGYYIDLVGDLHPNTEKIMKFYSSLPGMNVANAFRVACKFWSISSFMSRCNSVHNIMKETGLNREAATSVYQLLFTSPS